MKKLFVKILITVITCLTVVSLVSCSGGIKGEDAKAHIKEFFAAIADEDYTKAESLLHPERSADLEEYFLNIEKEVDVDFSEGIEIENYTNFSSAFYDSTVGGSTYELSMETKVGEKTVKFTIELVQNEAGFGIYNLDINF